MASSSRIGSDGSLQSARRFLSGEWKHLAMINFACSPELLEPFVPAGTELDTHAGVHQVSLVGFLFERTRVLGVPVPFHRSFEEVNLRFYVRRRGPEGVRRGVVFVRELVPKRAIAAVARLVYNERYLAVPMEHRVDLVDGTIPAGGIVEYEWEFAGRRSRMRCTVGGPSEEIPIGSEAEFITEHYWGYAAQRDGGTVEYRVRHPRWRVHPVDGYEVSGELAPLWGEAFAEVLAAPARSAFVATGSPIIVERGRRLDL